MPFSPETVELVARAACVEPVMLQQPLHGTIGRITLGAVIKLTVEFAEEENSTMTAADVETPSDAASM